MYLTSLGISPLQQGKPPTAASFPTAFNPETRNEWCLAVENLKSENVVKSHTLWQRCILDYIDLCMESGKYVFYTSSVNDDILDLLGKARITAVHYLNKFNILNHVAIKTIDHTCQLTDQGFVLDVDANVTVKDPTFAEYLIKHCLFKIHLYDDHSRECHLENNVSFYYVNRGTSQRLHFGYRITIPKYPRIPSNDTPKKQELEAFILNVLWLPVLKSHRPYKLAHRLL